MSEPAWRDAALELGGSGAPGSERKGSTPLAANPPEGPSEGPRVLTGRYLLEERVASGGMASVWRAHDEVLARTVAVKLLHDHLAADEAFRERFRREAIAAAKLTHSNVVSLYDTGTDGDCVYLVMEFIDGPTLKDVIREQGTLDIAQAATIGEQVARALDYAHSRGLVHRDVKPANILIRRDGTVKVADFGIAKADQVDDLTKTGMVLGTAAYVAPEQIRGETVDGKADQYALAVVLYEAVTGQQPFRADTAVATAAQRLERDPLPVRSLRAGAPRALDAVLMRALSRDPRDRFPTAGAFADALAQFASGNGDTAALVRADRPIDLGDDDATALGPGAGDSFLRSEGRFLAPVLGLLLLAAALVGVGLWTGVLEPGEDGFFPRIAGQEQTEEASPEETAVEPAEIELAALPTVFDPFGSGVERDQDLPNLVDGNPETFWRTERYQRPAFGNLKPGVGFYVDLGAPHRVAAVTLRTVTPGVTVELRGAAEPAGDIDSWTPMARVDAAGEVIELQPDDSAPARYLLVWVTGELPQFEGGFAAGFSHISVTGEPA